MARVSLPIFAPPRSAPASTALRADRVDRSKPYYSCEWLEGGLAFNRRSLHACLIVHHGRGFPHICDFNGGEVPMGQVIAARERMIAENQGDEGHAACKGCAHLVKKKWKQPKHPVTVVGIAQFAYCNIECNYCYLQTQDPASFADGFDPYKVLPAIEKLIADNHLAPDALLDWGGGEPTIYKEFDRVLELTANRGAKHWIHTNGTRIPKPLKNGLSTKKIHILCSVDAGFRETYKLMKNKDFLDLVWKNLAEYVRLGCEVVVKYIMKQENCSEPELLAFVTKAKEVGIRTLLIDIDYDYPNPTPEVLHGLRLLKRLALEYGFHAGFGFTGAKFTPEVMVEEKVDAGLYGRAINRMAKRVRRMQITAGALARGAARRMRRR